MQPTDVKPKTPENKAIFLLLIVIFLCQTLKGASACFGPVEKVKLYNDRGAKGSGYVEVKGKQVFARKDTDSFLYKISTQQEDHKASFFLYDPTEKKFICWNHSLQRVVGMDFKKINHSHHWPYCKFIDNPSERSPYLELLWASNSTVKMKFNQKGRYFSPKVLKNCKKRAKINVHQRHFNHCREYSDFLLLDTASASKYQCRKETYNVFCKGKLRNMPEVSDICNEMEKRYIQKQKQHSI